MRKADAAGITPDQARILALLDSGLSQTEVAEQLDMPPAVIGRQVARVRGKVLAGTYAPPLLPLEAAASTESHR
ncbi:MarR family transcriptional regulator [Burkholderia stagnalis]|uniref:MarR family transcriptional regulator n=1 Tax=Burkholderia stagnalis TaxID=1503054 RepID=A0ABX9YT74_9BURK|nr:MarR family transcriptional regulator [Burkholderia stagnalis]RQZ19578.1 MarR family transcriptional regulator [Burkholderia stagnalis]